MRIGVITQNDLEKVLHSIFPDKHIHRNAKKTSYLVSPHTGHFLEIDFYIPELKLAFEFQDPHHYATTGYSNYPIDLTTRNDDNKQTMLENRGETLVHVPFWWDGTASSLQASLYFQRPDLFSERPIGKPIPLEPPKKASVLSYIPNIGELMLESFVNPAFDPMNWWLGELYYGIRVCWNPSKKAMYMWTGVEVILPDFLYDQFPTSVFFDGELWLGRNSFRQLAVLGPEFHDFPEYMKFVTFDDANPRIREEPLEKRFANCVNAVPEEHPFLVSFTNYIPASYMKCYSKRFSKAILEIITKDYGVGIVCREPRSSYESGLSESFKKIQNAGMSYGLVVGAIGPELQITLPNGMELSVIPSDYEAKQGDVVTISNNYINRSTMEYTICGVNEISWDDVMNHRLPSQKSLRTIAQDIRVPYGHWTRDNENIRTFFNNLAEKHDFNPLVPANWYNVDTYTVRSELGGYSILAHYNGSISRALIDVYPEIGLDETQFPVVAKYYWGIPQNRRKFLDKYAQSKRFDPLIAENWYGINKQHIDEVKGSTSVLSYYGGSVVNALLELYPEVQFDEAEFGSALKRTWHLQRRRELFDLFAAKQGFNALVPENWYPIDPKELNTDKELEAIIRVRYTGSLLKALKDVYPNVTFNQRKFESRKHWHWHKLSNRKRFFDSLAAKFKFDPLVPTNWRGISLKIINEESGGRALMNRYRNSLTKALGEMYPTKLFGRKFPPKPRNYWTFAANRRKFLTEWATNRGLDSLKPSTWYNVSKSDLLKEKGGASLLAQYSGSLKDALLGTYPNIGLRREGFKDEILIYNFAQCDRTTNLDLT